MYCGMNLRWKVYEEAAPLNKTPAQEKKEAPMHKKWGRFI